MIEWQNFHKVTQHPKFQKIDNGKKKVEIKNTPLEEITKDNKIYWKKQCQQSNKIYQHFRITTEKSKDKFPELMKLQNFQHAKSILYKNSVLSFRIQEKL